MTSMQLVRLMKAGYTILHNGAPVEYRPRQSNDRSPWVFSDGRTVTRYTAAQCQAYKETA